MAEYVHFTNEQKQRANSVDLVEFLRWQGEQLIRSGREWRLVKAIKRCRNQNEKNLYCRRLPIICAGYMLSGDRYHRRRTEAVTELRKKSYCRP